MDAELRQYLQAMERRLQAMEQRLQGMEQHLEAMEQRINDRIEATETKLLTAFYEWSRPMEMRMPQLFSSRKRAG